MYKKPELFIHARNTGYVESFNRSIKLFHSKDVHFCDEDYLMRSNLAVLSWNENVGRPWFSRTVNNFNKTTRKILKPKTFHFKEALWKALVNNF